MQSQTSKIVLAAAITALIIIGGIYVWQKQADRSSVVTDTNVPVVDQDTENIPTTPDTTTVPSDDSPTPTSWQIIDTGVFRVSLPPGWKFNALQGYDSQVGEFVGNGVSLRFDYGMYSSSFPGDDNPNYIVTDEIINGYTAKIFVPKVTGDGATGIFISGIQKLKRLSLSGSNLTASEQETALQIFRTLNFDLKTF
ncbi:MAG: hypothetical protein WAZ14_03390 [Patescibacteria group bacterium]